ncbi:MAG: surface-adhesin E family protein [Tsuneonella sp.]
MFSRTLWLVLTVSCTSYRLDAADIQLHHEKDFDLITIEGEIARGDADRFRRIALQSNSGIVALESSGGALAEALEIGRAIQIAGYLTYVPANTICTSSCALIWVAGSKRLMSHTARIGFHASYRDNNGRLEEVGMANAMVGRYLTLLNLPERSIIFATAASPNDILWIKTDGSDKSGIEFEYLDLSEPETPAPPPIQTRPVEPVATQSAQESIPQWYYVTETSDGSKVYIRGRDVENSGKSSRSARFWLKTDDSKNRSSSYYSSMALYNLDCVSETYMVEVLNVYDAKGAVTQLGTSEKTSRIVPDSVLSDAAALVCSNDRPSPDKRDLP